MLVVPIGTEDQLMQGLLDAGQMDLPVALDFRQGDRWTINIYKADVSASGKAMLRVVGTLRAIPCDPASARRWEEGTGVVGASYSNRGEIVLPGARRVSDARRIEDDLDAGPRARHAAAKGSVAVSGDMAMTVDEVMTIASLGFAVSVASAERH